MPTPTPGYTKNMIKRSLREIIDPSPKPKERDEIWEYFSNECAYCGKKLDRSKREGHLDHLESSANKGKNHISNRVLSCVSCNSNEKLVKDWCKFIEFKNKNNKDLLKKRKDKIIKWKEKYVELALNKNVLKKIENAYKEITEIYDMNIEKIRKNKVNSK